MNSYRRAPKAPFPAAFDDSVTATKYFLSNAEKFHVDSRRVAIAGWYLYAHSLFILLYFSKPIYADS